MDIASAIGMLAGFGLIVASILMDGELSAFINAPGLLIVVGGTVAASLISESLAQVMGAFKVALKAFMGKSPQPEQTIKVLADLAVVVRREGLLALENQTIADENLAKGIRLAVDGIPADEIKATLRSSLSALRARHGRGRDLFKFMAATAPAMGMVGTLIGLVQMLQVMDDPSSIGPAMAVALLTTLYGAVLAFIVFGPIAQKLDMRSKEEAANFAVILEGLDSVLRGENARVVQEKLEVVLPPKARAGLESAA